MPDEHPKHPDSLDRDVTRPGRRQESADGDARSLGEQSTRGGQDSSMSDVGDLDAVGDSTGEVVDLAARYDIQGTLGHGGMGEVLRAMDKRLERPVAIKRIRGELASHRKAMDRFLGEAKALARLNHFNIVQVHDYGRDEEGPFIVMELVEGRSLQERLKEGALPEDQAVEMGCQLCDALALAHARGIIHRDIKPANILLTEREEPKLTDFGLARQEETKQGHTVTEAVLGTLDFMPPEQRRDGGQVDARSDLWSLGATLYQMVTGRSPRIVRLDLVSDSLRSVVGTVLEEAPDDRYQTAEALRDALRRREQQQVSFTTPDDLSSGECLSCHTLNPASRKFCRECGAPLTVPCLSCAATIPVWDKICGECGANQAELVAARQAELEEEKQEAESRRREYQYDEALAIANQHTEEADQRFRDIGEWASDFVRMVTEEWSAQQESAAAHYSKALDCARSVDYAGGIQALQSIPAPLRTAEMDNLLGELESHEEEWRRLEETIQTRMKDDEKSELLEPVTRLLELRPDRRDVALIKGQLLEKQAESLRRESCYEEAIAIAEQYTHEPGEELQGFRDWAERFVAEVTAEKAEQEQHLAARYAAAKRHKATCDYAAGIQALQSIPEPLRTGAVQQLLEDLQSLDEEWRNLQREIRDRLKQGEITELLEPVNRLRKLRPDLGDVARLQSELRNQVETEQKAKQQQAATKRMTRVALSVAGWACAGLVGMMLLVFIGNKMRSERELSSWTFNAQEVQAACSDQLGLPVEKTNSIGMGLTLIPPGEFMMGSPEDEEGRLRGEGPQHLVRITEPFYLGTTEVTQRQWEAVMGTRPWGGEEWVKKGKNYPAVCVSWKDAVAFCERLSEREERTYRLPTEAEWEYACRAGTDTAYSFGDDPSELGEYAWFRDNGRDVGEKYAHEVGRKRANDFGLYDMHGNVWEWCADCYDSDYYDDSPTEDPSGPTSGSSRVTRGGGWLYSARYCRSAIRFRFLPGFRFISYGFRVALVPAE